MTALKKYQRLECQGLWRETPEAQRRDVIVSFGTATLIIADDRSETALTHWSLPAVERRNPGVMPAIYAPGFEAAETLEIDDRVMIEALETVHQAVEAQRPHPGRMRNGLLGSGLALVLALGVFWMPGALVTHTARVVPPPKRQEIGRAVLADVARITGTTCADTAAKRPLARLTAKLFGPNTVTVEVMRDSPVPVAHLPGGILLLDRHQIENRDGPDVAAGYLLAERARAQAEDALVPLLRWAGVRATFHLLTTGQLPPPAIKGYGEALLARAVQPVPTMVLLEKFRAAGVPSTPYAHAIDPSGATTKDLIAGDPFGSGATSKPLLSDNEWVTLQGICTQ
ncbi:hypothetical protein GALL_411060 [mine drainage metagenome]|uniref:Uncharacterized protein n=1 Tax=mine drainage metagenome TaxID=410659 RepID=A0A1J5Q1K8_9ZZZZ